jgi:hypothetical protein
LAWASIRLWLSVVEHFFEACFLSPAIIWLKSKLATMEVEILSAWEALKMEQHEHFELRAAAELLCDALRAI